MDPEVEDAPVSGDELSEPGQEDEMELDSADDKTGWFKYPEAGQTTFAGTFIKDAGKYGFIKQDSGGPDMFVRDWSCVGGAFPAVGTRVRYAVVTDASSGKPRAEDVDVMDKSSKPQQSNWLQTGDTYTGTFIKNAGGHGYIRQDGCEDHAVVEPAECTGFEEKLPVPGTRVSYTVDMQGPGRFMALQVHPETVVESNEEFHGTVQRKFDNFGFIKPDKGGPHVFCYASKTSSVPQPGTRVVYKMVKDKGTGRPRADDVRPAHGDDSKKLKNVSPKPPSHPPATEAQKKGHNPRVIPPRLEENRVPSPASAPGSPANSTASGAMDAEEDAPVSDDEAFEQEEIGEQEMEQEDAENEKDENGWFKYPKAAKTFTGVFVKEIGKAGFGFIKQDAGGPDMFVKDWSCVGGAFPVIGTHVRYAVVTDASTGRPRAENVELQVRSSEPEESTWLETGDSYTGTFIKNAGGHGFIRQDGCEDYAVVEPAECIGFDQKLPVPGTRVSYTVDVQGPGMFMALEVQPETLVESNEEFHGTIHRNLGVYGFIKPDKGGPHVFCYASKTSPIPEPGTRVAYKIVIVKDKGTGRPKADNVRLLNADNPKNSKSKGLSPKPPSHPPAAMAVRQGQGHNPRVIPPRLEENRVPSPTSAPDKVSGQEELADEDMQEVDHDDEEEVNAAQTPIQPLQTRLLHSRAWIEVWNRYCDEHGGGVRDPEEHGAGFLRRFLDEALRNNQEEEVSQSSEELLAQVRKAQSDAPSVWAAYCGREADGVTDPEKHSASSLQHFLGDIYVYLTVDRLDRSTHKAVAPAAKKRAQATHDDRSSKRRKS
eukprot:TRINITY_DN2990_c0_g1_i1.p1 TRINITY_DN2990_c0_g1~~TRINITY_DN2990_c0_g1_i1.p1  ORF type:complete len:863 (-),score=173.12 TRINITY_DN2990_c0_g1_i1:72-2537(-)